MHLPSDENAPRPVQIVMPQPYVPVKGECGVRLELEVSYLEGRKHLHVSKFREAA